MLISVEVEQKAVLRIEIRLYFLSIEPFPRRLVLAGIFVDADPKFTGPL